MKFLKTDEIFWNQQMVGIETLATVGLGLDAAGALMVVLPEFEQFRAYKTPEDEIQQIERGRVTLLSEGKLTSDDSGFEAVCEALDGRVEVHGPIKEIVVVSLEDEPDAVEVRYHTDGDSIHARDGRISRTLVDRYIERHVHQLEQRAREWSLRAGSSLLLFGFLLQIAASLL
ncbi:hypothetical protein OB916_08230 [Halobacteria archaeon HArc-curdl5-1]|uniref:Uncharacterized protein n=2 Tax=Halapricum hydrolyticum TaxID=2979991 RepID=A0ABT2Q2F5_9EURY|nr:hypothetical protein [Halapricum hydrolyticum]